MSEENAPRVFTLKFNEGTDFEEVSDIKVWCEGREYDPVQEVYRPRYSYTILSEDWEYVNNDIFGVKGDVPDVGAACRSLLAYLFACQEGYPQVTDGENSDLFPDHVREWAYLHNDLITQLYEKLVQETEKV